MPDAASCVNVIHKIVDMPNAVPLEQMNYYLNSQLNARSYEAVASRGVGVFDTLKYISKLVISKL